MKKVQNGVTTIYIGALYEKNLSTGEVTTYYFAGSQRIAMRKNGGAPTWFIADHLGSTSLALDANGNEIANTRQKYYPFGETRGTATSPTDRQFTGQRREDTSLGSLYDFNARFYSPGIMRFISADTIVPDPTNPQTFNRYSYVNNRPLSFADPTGHCGVSSKTGDEKTAEIAQCKQIRASLEDDYGITIDFPENSYAENGVRQWYLSEMESLQRALTSWAQALGGRAAAITQLGLRGMTIELWTSNKMHEDTGDSAAGGVYKYQSSLIAVSNSDRDKTQRFAHELAHAWERHYYNAEAKQWLWGGQFPSFRTAWFSLAFGTFNSAPIDAGGWIADGMGWSPYAKGAYDNDITKPWEDFAETAGHIIANTSLVRKDSARYKFMIALMPGLQQP